VAAQRRATYVALVEAVGRAGRSQVDPARAHAAARELAAIYDGSLAPTRQAIDEVLDGLGRLRFAQLDLNARLALLRRLPDADLVARAVALAALPFHPPADDYHPTPVAL
jgi:hypothetical protein